MKFPLNTQFTFGWLTFAAGEDGDLKMLPLGPMPEHPTPAPSSASGATCSGLDPFAGLYIRTVKLVRGIPIVTSTLRPSIRASSSSSSASSPGRNSFDDYPQIGASACGNSAEDDRLILMVAPNRDRSRNNSSRYPTIGISEASDAQTPSVGLIQNLNPDFNAVRVQVIMETIQRMAPDGSTLALLTREGDEAANLVIAEKSVGVPRGNRLLATTIGQGVSEVKPHPQPVQIGIYLSKMHAGASHRTIMRGTMAVIGMTSTTLLKIGGASKTEHQVHHHQGKVGSAL
jgi:hypothetical protein